MTRRLIQLAALALLAATATVATPQARANGVPAMPPAATFRPHVDNPWFPLVPGSRYVYVGVKDGKPSRDVLTVTRAVKTIDGVPCVVVNDRLYLRGRLEERTTDWYAQDARGNVWYFGEGTAELDTHGQVTSRSGSWLAGTHGARPGIYMPADPHVGQSGQQELLAGEAEDHYKVIGRFGTVVGPASTNRC